MHTLLDYDGHFPAYINVTNGKMGDNRGALDIPIAKGSVVVADRFYNDYSLLNFWHTNGVFYVVRSKKNLSFTTIKELELPEDKYQHLLKDEIVEIANEYTQKKYPEKFRRIALWDDKNQEVVEMITNQMSWTANTIGELYKARWQIEVFFRDIKQQLHIKSFIGTTPNAVMIQIWTAMITILILKVLKALAKYPWYLSNLIAFIRLNLFVKVELQKWLDNPFLKEKPPPKEYIQGVLF